MGQAILESENSQSTNGKTMKYLPSILMLALIVAMAYLAGGSVVRFVVSKFELLLEALK